LLAPTDPVSPIRTALADALRKALLDAHAAHEKAHAAGTASLASSPVWERLTAADRAGILTNVGLEGPPSVDAPSDVSLLAALDGKSLSARQADADAVPGRVQKALEQAARLLEPKVRPISIERATLTTPDDVQHWADRQQKALLDAIKVGPVLVS